MRCHHCGAVWQNGKVTRPPELEAPCLSCNWDGSQFKPQRQRPALDIVADWAMDIMDGHQIAMEADAGFDGGEFSGPAHERMMEKEITELAELYGYTYDEVIGEVNRMQHEMSEQCGCGSPGTHYHGNPCCGGSMCCPEANR